MTVALLTLATECDHYHHDTTERGEVRRLPIVRAALETQL